MKNKQAKQLIEHLTGAKYSTLKDNNNYALRKNGAPVRMSITDNQAKENTKCTPP